MFTYLKVTTIFRAYSCPFSSIEEVHVFTHASRRPSTSDIDHVQKAREVICANRRLTVREAAAELNISTGLVSHDLIEKLQMRSVAARFVPRLPTAEQEEDRVRRREELWQANPDLSLVMKLGCTGMT